MRNPMHFGMLLGLACLTALTGHSLAATESGIKLGRHGFYGTPISSIGIEGDVDGGRFRLVAEDRFPGFLLADHFGLGFSAFSVAYYNTGNGPYVSLNPATLLFSTILGFASVPDSGKVRPLTYWGASPYATAMLLPQLLTNWSVRLDLIKQKLGVSIGPATDVLAGSSIWIRSELQSGLYLNALGLGVKGFGAYDLIEKRNRFYFRLSKVFGN